MKRFAVAVPAAIFAAMIIACGGGGGGGGGVGSTADPHGAWVAMQDFVKDRLTSPASADFPFGGGSKHVTHLGDGKYLVDSYVDSQNGFGAMLRTKFRGVVRSGDGKWHLLELAFDGETVFEGRDPVEAARREQQRQEARRVSEEKRRKEAERKAAIEAAKTPEQKRRERREKREAERRAEERRRRAEQREAARKAAEKQAESEKRAASRLRLAKALMRSGKAIAGRERLQEIVDEHPGTKAAGEAAELLKE